MNKQEHPPRNCYVHIDHECSLWEEIICHLPYAIFSAAFGLILISLMSFYGTIGHQYNHNDCSNLDVLFHSFHFLHLVFAATGALVTFSRFSQNILKGFLVALLSALFFCSLSDIILPYFAGCLVGIDMHFHICLVSEIQNVLPFLFVGLINGLVMSQHSSSIKGFYSVMSHFGHILVSSLASLFYLIGQGFDQWQEQMGIVFILLILVVVVPCTLADVIVPVIFARNQKNQTRH